jgi:ribosome maturation factor RimP
MDRTAVTQRVWELAEPLALQAGLELIDVQYRPEAGRVILRLLVDRPTGGVTLDELARLSRELGDVLDAHEAVPGRYCLECSSPGVDRPLVRPTHWQRALGKRVHVRTHAPIGGRRQFHGTLESATDDTAVVADPDAGRVTVPLADVEKAHVEFQFARPGGTPPAHA